MLNPMTCCCTGVTSLTLPYTKPNQYLDMSASGNKAYIHKRHNSQGRYDVKDYIIFHPTASGHFVFPFNKTAPF